MSPHIDLQLNGLTLPATNPGDDPEESGSYQGNPKTSPSLPKSARSPTMGCWSSHERIYSKLTHRTTTFPPIEGKKHAVYQKAV
jgi:hypothetical protein